MSKNRTFVAGMLLLSMMLPGLCSCKTQNLGERMTTSAGTMVAIQKKDTQSGGTVTTPVSENPGTAVTNPKSDAQEEDSLQMTLSSKHKLSFDEEGDFKILVFSDVHGQNATLAAETKANIQLLVDRENPDLVIFDGDNTFGVKNVRMLKSCLEDMVGYIEEKKIPWMHVYGNHDDEFGAPAKKQQQKIYEEFTYCISKTGEDLTGVGNYVIPIYASGSDRVAFAVWALDSGGNLSDRERKQLFGSNSFFEGHPNSEYDYIHPDQIQWYYATSKLLQRQNGGKVVPGLMAFHIPLQESYYAWQNRSALTYTGERREDVCASAVNSGLFSVLVERGDIKAVVNGHDHVNDYMVECCGIKLCQASTPTAENIYHDDDILGCRAFVIHEKDPSNVTTYLSYVHEQQPKPDFSDAKPILSGTVYDFEGEMPEVSVCGFDNNTSSEAHIDEILVTVTEGVGVNGTKALSVTRKKWYDHNTGNNAELTFAMDRYGKLGSNRYLRVWMDLGSNDLDFRKAGFGLIVEQATGKPYRTDDYDKTCPFYYQADGTDKWVELSCGSDGCFGAGDGQSVKGLKGWFAFPVEYMMSGSNHLNADSVVTGYYFYFSFASSEMPGKSIYLDNLTLTEDYTSFASAE